MDLYFKIKITYNVKHNLKFNYSFVLISNLDTHSFQIIIYPNEPLGKYQHQGILAISKEKKKIKKEKKNQGIVPIRDKVTKGHYSFPLTAEQLPEANFEFLNHVNIFTSKERDDDAAE